MKKLLVLMMALTMALSLAACGEPKADAPASDPQSTDQPSVEVPADKVDDEQAKADADYAQLKGFVDAVNTHQGVAAKMGETTNKVKNGEATEAELLEVAKEVAADSKALLDKIQAATWQTEYYTNHLAALTNAVAAIASAEELTYQAGSENDEAKLEQVPALMATYDEQLGALLDLLGVE